MDSNLLNSERMTAMSNGDRKRAASRFQPTGQWIRSEKRLAIYLRDSFRCVYCGKDLHSAKPADVTLDHLEPRSNGGMNHETNLVTACHACNCTRSDKDLADFASKKALRKIEHLRWMDLTGYRELAVDIISKRRGSE